MTHIASPLEDLSLEISHGTSQAAKLSISAKEGLIVSLELTSDDALSLAETLREHALVQNSFFLEAFRGGVDLELIVADRSGYLH